MRTGIFFISNIFVLLFSFFLLDMICLIHLNKIVTMTSIYHHYYYCRCCKFLMNALQIAAYLGFKNIYLIGVDADYEIPADVEQGDDYHVGVLDMKSDDPNHFHPDYFGKGFRWHDPQVHKMIEAYHEARKATEKSGQKIWNAGVGGKLEVFDRVDFSNILPDALTSSSVRLVNEAREIIDSYGSKERLTAKKLKSICQSRTVRR